MQGSLTAGCLQSDVSTYGEEPLNDGFPARTHCRVQRRPALRHESWHSLQATTQGTNIILNMD